MGLTKVIVPWACQIVLKRLCRLVSISPFTKYNVVATTAVFRLLAKGVDPAKFLVPRVCQIVLKRLCHLFSFCLFTENDVGFTTAVIKLIA